MPFLLIQVNEAANNNFQLVIISPRCRSFTKSHAKDVFVLNVSNNYNDVKMHYESSLKP